MELILTILASLITIISLAYAIYSNRKHSKLINYNREQSWEIYRQASKVLAHFQALENLNSENKEFITHIAKGESATQELTLNTIKMIKRFENKFDSDTIKKWEQEGRLANESHVKAFKGYL